MLDQQLTDMTIGQLISYGLMIYGGYLVVWAIVSLIFFYIINKYLFE